jgi:uncharacterized protein
MALDIFYSIINKTGEVILQSGIYLMLGFFVAALFGAFFRAEVIARFLGGNKLRSVVNAAILGIPIPLCSCGVISAASVLRKRGASRAATLSFLISTPQTGIDSLSISYALLGLPLTLVRLLSAFVAAFLAGAMEIMFGRRQDKVESKKEACPSCCSSTTPQPQIQPRLKTRVSMSLRSTFGMVFDEILTPLWIGLLLAGVIAHFINPEIIKTYLGMQWWSMLVALGAGLPLYICATASTPIVASLLYAGMSPGAAVVFLLAGPATNATTMTVVGQQLGKRSLALYLGSIIFCSLMLGWLTNLLFSSTTLGNIQTDMLHHHEESYSLFHWLGAIIFVVWTIRSYAKRWYSRHKASAKTAEAVQAD